MAFKLNISELLEASCVNGIPRSERVVWGREQMNLYSLNVSGQKSINASTAPLF